MTDTPGVVEVHEVGDDADLVARAERADTWARGGAVDGITSTVDHSVSDPAVAQTAPLPA